MRGNGHDVYRISANGVFQFMPLHERQRIAFRIPKVDIFYFNSRLYMRGNWNYWKTCRWWHISIHASTWEATHMGRCKQVHQKISIHASTWEATNRSASAWRRWRNFNSRLYMRGNEYTAHYSLENPISIHASTWEATYAITRRKCDECNFNSCLYMRGNPDSGKDGNEDHIFQFTPLHERRPSRIPYTDPLLIFQFTPLHERRQSFNPNCNFFPYFNSRLYTRGDSSWLQTCWSDSNFNSRLCMRGNTLLVHWNKSPREFQFSPLHERQLAWYHRWIMAQSFQFSPLHERQPIKQWYQKNDQNFNSRLCMRGNHC